MYHGMMCRRSSRGLTRWKGLTNIDFPQKLNGSMRVGRGVPPVFTMATMKPSLESMLGMTKIVENQLTRLDKRNPTHGVCMICMAMCGNGVRIGKVRLILQVIMLIQKDLHQARTGCSMAAAGAASPSAVEHYIGSVSPHSAGP